MRYQRLHIRVPASGNAVLSAGKEIVVEASIINVSAGGLSITAPSHLIDKNEYHVQITTSSNVKIHFYGFPVYQTNKSIGIKITSIEKEHLKNIYQIVEGFQLSRDFIKYIEEKDIIHDWLVDESGEDIAITFDAEPSKYRRKIG